MNCNSKIHDEFRNMGEFNCPFCDIKLEDSDEKPQDSFSKIWIYAVIVRISSTTMGC